jgi:hypothetical protein
MGLVQSVGVKPKKLEQNKYATLLILCSMFSKPLNQSFQSY